MNVDGIHNQDVTLIERLSFFDILCFGRKKSFRFFGHDKTLNLALLLLDFLIGSVIYKNPAKSKFLTTVNHIFIYL